MDKDSESREVRKAHPQRPANAELKMLCMVSNPPVCVGQKPKQG